MERAERESLNRRVVEEASRVKQAVAVLAQHYPERGLEDIASSIQDDEDSAHVFTDDVAKCAAKHFVELRDDLLVALATNPARES